MTLRDLLILCSTSTLIFSGWFYGWKFLRMRNVLLGLEWWVLGFSATHFFVYMGTGSELSGAITFYCDAFSRALGVPLIAALGIMRVTHDCKPSHVVEVGLFAITALIAHLARTVWLDTAGLQYFYLVGTVGFAFFMLYFSWTLFRAKVAMHGIAIIVVTGASSYIAVLEGGFFAIQNDSTNLFFNEWFMALLVWGVQFAEIYYAYCALARAKGREDLLEPRAVRLART